MDDGSHKNRYTNEDLYYRQVAMLKEFLERDAITQAQFDKSVGDLTRLMGFKENKCEQQ